MNLVKKTFNNSSFVQILQKAQNVKARKVKQLNVNLY